MIRRVLATSLASNSEVGYEFSADENKTFERLVRKLSSSGLVVIIASLILLGWHLVAYFGISAGKAGSWWITVDYVVWVLISVSGVVMGVLLIRATRMFAALIRTEGDDLSHLMQGIARLADILHLVFWAGAVASILLATSLGLLLTYS